MIATIIITIFTIVGIYLQSKKDESKDDSKRKNIGKWTMRISITLLVANSILQSIDSKKNEKYKTSLESINKELIQKLDLCNSSIKDVGSNQNNLEKKYDSLLVKNLSTELLLKDAYNKIDKLTESTNEGFKKNEEAIGHIERIKVKNARSISPADKKRMIAELKKFSGNKILFATVNTSDEAILFSGDLQDIFKKAGWTTTDERWLAPNSDYKGMFLFGNQVKQPAYALTIYNLLNSLGYKFQAINEPKYDEKTLKIIIGFNE